MKEELQQIIKDTATICLRAPQEHKNYTPEDLFNASLVFVEVFNDLAFTHMKTLPITNDGRLELVEELGKNLRQTILLGTGIDMHEEAKK